MVRDIGYRGRAGEPVMDHSDEVFNTDRPRGAGDVGVQGVSVRLEDDFTTSHARYSRHTMLVGCEVSSPAWSHGKDVGLLRNRRPYHVEIGVRRADETRYPTLR